MRVNDSALCRLPAAAFSRLGGLLIDPAQATAVSFRSSGDAPLGLFEISCRKRWLAGF